MLSSIFAKYYSPAGKERTLTVDQPSVRSVSSPSPVSLLTLPPTQGSLLLQRHGLHPEIITRIALGCGSTLVTLIVTVIIKGTPEPGILSSSCSQGHSRTCMRCEFPGDGSEWRRPKKTKPNKQKPLYYPGHSSLPEFSSTYRSPKAMITDASQAQSYKETAMRFSLSFPI